MIEEVLSKRNLNQAYKQVCANKGSGGIDGMQITELSSHLKTHSRTFISQIRSGSYRPSPIKGVKIPKANGKTRLLGIPTVTDRVFQQALHQVLQPLFEPDFQDGSYGFRPKRNAHQAVEQSLDYINSGYQQVIDIDLKSFFDEVDHDFLLSLIYKKMKCKATMKLLRKFLKAPILISKRLHERKKGVPQGSPLSPLLSNILLNELDKELESRGHCYVRYADDFSIYVKSKRSARRVGNSIYKYLRDQLLLPINREKSGIRRPLQFEILGYGFVSSYRKGSKGKYQLVVGKQAWKVFKQKLKALTRKTIPMSFDERITRLKRLKQGWINYFKLSLIQGKLKALDEWLRNRLRYCIWHYWKKPEKKRRSLIRLGISSDQAYAWSRTRMGGWAVAQSPILRTTVTLKRLEQKEYLSVTKYYLQIRSS
ncbi:group II intron reverse transcriptase/maturase [Aquimarina sp. U1-2]|uniref:group II intron reverse transcriptase/maturase n=1 Tax=Aquimarina sp. U1-2 TaxID=2823141 RepID=UPI001AECCEAF|nr:group II intron reverse transcriptase/maturase [Aquimarina sp. U1-2]MBP2831275.1 group II intron reverse transcriptase/maturase [Aquimarina sp. U1-2]